MYPTKKEFQDLLQTRELDWIIERHLFQGAPFYSSHNPQLHGRMIREISLGLGVPKDDICVVGSARVGFSLAPHRFGEPFNEYSDLDVVVVSPELFDPSWIDILTRRRTAKNRRTRSSLWAHRERHYVYNGWIYPGSLVDALGIGESWLRTFNGLSRIVELAGRPVAGRLYRTWDHARFYHQRSLGQLKAEIEAAERKDA